MAELVGIFGGTGALVLAVGTYLCKQWGAHDTSFFRGVPISNQPTVTLRNTWEDGAASDEENKHYHRMKYATKDGHAWKVTIQDRGGVFVYADYYSKPSTNDGHAYLRLRLKGVPPDAKLWFVQKHWGGLVDEYKRSVHFPDTRIPLEPRDGIHTFSAASLIGSRDDDDVTKEQVGLYVDGHGGVEYEDMRIVEAYDRERTSICTVFCCAKKALFSVFYRKKREARS